MGDFQNPPLRIAMLCADNPPLPAPYRSLKDAGEAFPPARMISFSFARLPSLFACGSTRTCASLRYNMTKENNSEFRIPLQHPKKSVRFSGEPQRGYSAFLIPHFSQRDSGRKRSLTPTQPLDGSFHLPKSAEKRTVRLSLSFTLRDSGEPCLDATR